MRSAAVLSALVLTSTLGSAALAAPSTRALVHAGRSAALAPVRGDDPARLEAAARAALRERAPFTTALSLGAARATTLRSGARVLRLPQFHEGLPVALRSASVTFDAGGAARLVALRLEEDLPADTTPALTAEQAAAVASTAVRGKMRPESARLAIWPTPDRPILAWVLSARALELPVAPVVVVDATTGKVVLRYNAASSALHEARVFPSNPVKSPDLINVTLPLEAGAAALTNDLVRSRNCIDQQSVKQIDLGLGFPISAHICDLLPTATPSDAVEPDFLAITPAEDTAPEDAFAELSIFYHTNRAYELFRGFEPGFRVQDGPIDTVSNLRIPPFDPAQISDPNSELQPFQNAFFSPGDPLFANIFGIEGATMWFGQGPNKDYSYDGDVVYHEFGHAVVNATIQLVGFPHHDEYGIVVSPGGMNEGLADYFSSAITGDGDVGEYASQDFAPGLAAIRSLTAPDSCPTAIGGEVHQDATLFTGGLWDVRKTLSADDAAKMDLAVFTAMKDAPSGDLNYDELANLIVEEVKEGMGTAAADALTAAFTARGVLPRCKRILEYTGEELNGPEALSGLWFAPGTQSTMLDAIGYTPGVIQVHASLPERAESMTLSFLEVQVNAGGLGGLFGGQQTAFTPKVLVRFGEEPVQFSYEPYATTADVLVVDPQKSGDAYAATVEVPEGATSVYVMIGNAGQGDGAYKALQFSFTQAAGEGGAGGGTDTPTPPTNGGSADDDSGCGCSVPGQTGPRGALAALALAGVSLGALRRRARKAAARRA